MLAPPWRLSAALPVHQHEVAGVSDVVGSARALLPLAQAHAQAVHDRLLDVLRIAGQEAPAGEVGVVSLAISTQHLRPIVARVHGEADEGQLLSGDLEAAREVGELRGQRGADGGAVAGRSGRAFCGD